MTEELKACPFCGTAPTIIYKESPANHIRCEGRCPANPSVANHSGWKACVKDWNTRAIEE